MRNRFSLKGRIALVTGASSGIGRHFAGTLAEAGAHVVAAARREERLAEVVRDIRENGGQAVAVGMDVTGGEGVRAAFDFAEATFGTVDVLVNNAGIAHPEYFLELDEAGWDRVMDTNLKGAWRVASEAARRMVDAGKPGSIINMSSLLAMATQTKQTAYAVSKAGVSHLTRMMASELARYGIRVNAIAPGYFLTEMNEEFFSSEKGQAYVKHLPLKRIGELPELDGALLLLASDAGAYISGVVIPVDGGQLVQGS